MNDYIPEHGSPCESLKELQKEVEKHGLELAKGTTNFVVINTKLNMIIAVMGVLGVAICSVMAKYMFQ